MKLIYIYDPICGWCYGFTPMIQEIQAKFKGEMSVEVLSGGMLLSANRRPASAMFNYIKEAHKQVEATTGITFGQPFLEQYLRSDDMMDSEKPSIALTVFKHYQPDNAVNFAHDMQVALNLEGKSLNDDQTYRELLVKYNIPAEQFLQRMQEDDNKYATHQEFNIVQQWGITGFPAAILEKDEELYLIARGFTPMEKMLHVIDEIRNK
jgi:putative protein-disulfide isomerase